MWYGVHSLLEDVQNFKSVLSEVQIRICCLFYRCIHFMIFKSLSSSIKNSFKLKFNEIILLKYTWKPVTNQLSLSSIHFLPQGTKFTVLNRWTGGNLESEATWSLVSPSPDRKHMLCYWASFFIESLCLFFRLVYLVSAIEIAHFNLRGVIFGLFLKFYSPWSFEIVFSFLPARAEVDLWVLLHSLLCGESEACVFT